MSAKEKLLAALADTTLEDVEVERLVDVLLDKVRRLEADNERLRGENAQERLTLHSDREALHRDMSRLRSDPLFGAHGQYRFDAPDNVRIIIRMQSGVIREVALRRASIDYLCHQMPIQAP